MTSACPASSARPLRCISLLLLCACVLWPAPTLRAQDDPDGGLDSQLQQMNITPAELPLCFGMRDIEDPKALAICDALRLNQNVRARELSERWVRGEPDNPAAQFALAEVLYSVEANLPRALFHLKRAEELTNYPSLGRALASGNIQWHYLTLSQLSFIHQLMGDQVSALAYLDKIEEVYALDVESLRGWPLIKLKEYDLAKESAEKVLASSDSERERARAWNTLCAAELASLRPKESLVACDKSIAEDEDIAATDGDTVYLTNASEVSLSLLQFQQAEAYLDLASRFLNPDSVADPWIYKLYLTMNQSRLEEAADAFDRMLLWRESQVPVVTVMNRAEHLMVSAAFLILAGHGEEAARLTATAINEPDRNGSYSADDAQKDSVAALLHMLANETWYQQRLERAATLDFSAAWGELLAANRQRFAAWRAARRASSLFADRDVLLNRLRPYAPLDVHIPEWIEPEIVHLIGSGVMHGLLEQASGLGAFMLNDGYYYSYATEIAAHGGREPEVLQLGRQALDRLPQEEVLLRARVHARMADVLRKQRQTPESLAHYRTAIGLDPGVIRRLGLALPVRLTGDGSEFARLATGYLARSPRFAVMDDGFVVSIGALDNLSLCLHAAEGETIACATQPAAGAADAKESARFLVNTLHDELFNLDYQVNNAQIAVLRGSSVIMRSGAGSGNRAANSVLGD